jgi:hemerythrin-like metal-binding protein
MALMEWADSFAVGVAAMDQQHKQLIEKINQLDEAVRVSIKNPAIQNVLALLVQYTTSHFEDEEQLMRETGFAGLGEHHEVHQKLLRAVTEVLDKVKSGKLSAAANLAAFLHFWLEKHIAGYDQLYGRHIAGLKTASAAR